MLGSNVYLIGVVGGLSHELMHWRGLQRSNKLPRYVYKVHYWVLTVLFALLGGVLAKLSGQATLLGAFLVGASAPAILAKGTLAFEAPKAGAAAGVGLGDWLRG